MRRGCGHGIDDCPTSCMEALSEMASEIDEAAAVEWANEVLTRRVPFTIALDYNLARAALAWKARSDALANKWDALIRPESILPLQAAKDWRERAEELQDTLGLAQLAAQTWKHRAEAAEAERDELRQAVKSLTKLADLAEVSR